MSQSRLEEREQQQTLRLIQRRHVIGGEKRIVVVDLYLLSGALLAFKWHVTMDQIKIPQIIQKKMYTLSVHLVIISGTGEMILNTVRTNAQKELSCTILVGPRKKN